MIFCPQSNIDSPKNLLTRNEIHQTHRGEKFSEFFILFPFSSESSYSTRMSLELLSYGEETVTHCQRKDLSPCIWEKREDYNIRNFENFFSLCTPSTIHSPDRGASFMESYSRLLISLSVFTGLPPVRDTPVSIAWFHTAIMIQRLSYSDYHTSWATHQF